MLETIAEGIGIGFTAGALPGPFQVFLLFETLRYGFRHSAWLVPAPLISDAPIVVIMLLILGQASDGLLRGISFVGGCFVLYIAWGIWQHLKSGGFHLDTENPVSESHRTLMDSLRQAIAINAFSPGPWLFWGTVNGPLLVAAWRKAPQNGIGFVFSFYSMFLFILLAEVSLFHQARHLGNQAVNLLLRVGFVILILFGFYLWIQAFQ